MPQVKINNNAASRLASSLTNASTSLSVTSGEGAKFPAPTGGDWFPVTVLKSSGQFEIMRCTARTADVLTVTRGQEGTSALPFDAGDRIELRATAAVFAELQSKTADALAAAGTAQAAADAAQTSANTAQSEVDALEGLAVTKDANTTTGAAKLPAGTTAQRPGTPSNGWERYNTDLKEWERYQDGKWLPLNIMDKALNEAPPVALASASTVNIGAAAANTINITGSVTITAFDTVAAGAKRTLVFGGASVLTHNATSMILPGGANITPAAGDVAEFVSLGGGNWRCVQYQKAVALPALASDKNRCTAWVNFDGTGAASLNIRDSYNVSSITDNGTGNYTINFQESMVNTNYSVIGQSLGSSNAAYANRGMPAKTTSGVNMIFGGTASAQDYTEVSIHVFGGK